MAQRDTLWQFIRSRKFLFHLTGMVGFYVAVILLFAFCICLYTHHGQSIAVPDVRGKSFDAAVKLLKDKGLDYAISDSLFNDTLKPLAVMDQQPMPQASVKEYRTIYLTVNSKVAPEIQLPDLKDVSLKQASTILQNYGLKIGTLSYKPDLGKDLVLEASSHGKPLKAGSTVRKGTRIDLVLGDGLGQTQLEVPDIVGMTLREAKFVLDGSGLNIGALVFDASVKDDTLDAVVYKQIPDSKDLQNNMINVGEGVDVFLTSPSDYDSNQNDDPQ